MSDKIERQRLDLEHQRLRLEADRIAFEASHNFARDAIRNAVLINGAAAIALLTFLGHDQVNSVADTTKLTSALMSFGFGVAAAAVCSLLAYIFQTTNREVSEWRILGEVLRIVAVLSGVGAIVFFIRGLWIASTAFAPAGGLGFWE